MNVWVRMYYWLNTCIRNSEMRCVSGYYAQRIHDKRVLLSCWIGTLQIYSPPMSVLCATIDWGMAQQISWEWTDGVCTKPKSFKTYHAEPV